MTVKGREKGVANATPMTDKAPLISLSLPQMLGVDEARELGRNLEKFTTKVAELDRGREGA